MCLTILWISEDMVISRSNIKRVKTGEARPPGKSSTGINYFIRDKQKFKLISIHGKCVRLPVNFATKFNHEYTFTILVVTFVSQY